MIVKYKATTSSRRFLVLIDRSGLNKGKPVKSLCCGYKRSSGRNNRGVITVRHIGGGHKRKLRTIIFDFREFLADRSELNCVVERIEYDPGRSAFIALSRCVEDERLFYMIAVGNLKVGDPFSIVANASLQYDKGCVTKLALIPNGTVISCVEQKVGSGMSIARSAGTSAVLVKKYDKYALVTLRSGRKMHISLDCFAIIGVVSNADHSNQSYAKAGRKRWLGVRPCVRGVVMNPVDHPHGGGEGKSKSGRHPCTPWGKLTKGKKTVIKKRNI